MDICIKLLLTLLFFAFPDCVQSKEYKENLWGDGGQCNNKTTNMMISWSNEIEIRLTPPVDTSEYTSECTMVAEFNDTSASGLYLKSTGRTVCTTEVTITASCRERLVCYKKEIKCGSTHVDEYWENAYKIRVTVTSPFTGMGDESKPLMLSVAPVYNQSGTPTKGIGKAIMYVIIAVVVIAVLVFIGIPLCLCFCCKKASRSANIQQPQPGTYDHNNGLMGSYNSGKFNSDGVYKQYSHEQ